MTTIEQILEERGKTHGQFTKVSTISQQLKRILITSDMSDSLRESMEMICNKLARIVCGDCYETDHWADISGYALLVARDLASLNDKASKIRSSNLGASSQISEFEKLLKGQQDTSTQGDHA